MSSLLEFSAGGFRFYGNANLNNATGVNLAGGGNNFNLFATLDNTGKFGIGTQNPAQNFVVSNGGAEGLEVYLNQPAGTVGLQSYNRSVSNYSKMQFDASSFSFQYGDVGIGTINPDSKLTVKGKIHAEEVKVDLSVPGPDYVFEKDYPILSLKDLKNYIEINKHLPEVPSAKDMARNGINLSEMNMMLLKKIEELTLHLIEKDKELTAEKQKNKKQDERLGTIEALLTNLHKK